MTAAVLPAPIAPKAIMFVKRACSSKVIPPKLIASFFTRFRGWAIGQLFLTASLAAIRLPRQTVSSPKVASGIMRPPGIHRAAGCSKRDKTPTNGVPSVRSESACAA